MKRCFGRGLRIICTGITLSVGIGGCASWNRGNETIVRIESNRNPAKARRLTLVGVKEMGLANIDAASQKFLHAIAADETYGPAHNNLGLLHYEQGNLFQAVMAFEQAMEFMPTDPIVYYNLALTLEAAGKVHEAMDLYWQAIEMAPANPVFLGNLVRLRIRLGETGPELNSQLEDLVLIETRPEWRRWADRQLSLFFNDALDRGPQTPEFDPGDSDDPAGRDAYRVEDHIIDLTPPRQPPKESSTESPDDGASLRLSSPLGEIPPPPPAKPLLVPDAGAIGPMPPSIELLPEPGVPEVVFQ